MTTSSTQNPDRDEILSKLQDFTFGGRKFKITDPSVITIRSEDAWTEIAIDSLGILAGGRTTEEAIEDFEENVSITWKVLIDSDVNTLSQCAWPVRKAFHKQIKSHK